MAASFSFSPMGSNQAAEFHLTLVREVLVRGDCNLCNVEYQGKPKAKSRSKEHKSHKRHMQDRRSQWRKENGWNIKVCVFVKWFYSHLPIVAFRLSNYVLHGLAFSLIFVNHHTFLVNPHYRQKWIMRSVLHCCMKYAIMDKNGQNTSYIDYMCHL